MKFPYRTVNEITPDLRGFYRIDHAAYHEGRGISSTAIKRALVSYAHYVYKETFDTAALAFGRAFHAALLEPELFAKQWSVLPQFDGHPNSNKYQDAKNAWMAENQGREVITCDAMSTIAEMKLVLRQHPEYAKLPKFDAEIMAITRDEPTQMQIKCKADLFGSAIVDFKTTSGGLQPSEFLNDMIKWKYHVSAALYQDIITDLTGERLPFIVVPVTKKAPFECEFYRLSDEILDEGRKLWRAGLTRIHRWATQAPEVAAVAEKRLRVLQPSSRLLYSTTDTLLFLEG